MTIKNVRQFNNELNSFFNAGIDGITNILEFSTRMIELHGNKERLQSFFNHAGLRTQNGKIRAQFKKQAQYMLTAVPAIELGYFEHDNNLKKDVFKRYTLDTLPLQLSGKDIHINKDKEFKFVPFDEWINKANNQGADDTKPVKPVTAKAFCKQLETAIERGLIGDNAELDKVSDLIKQALNAVAKAYTADDTATVIAADELAKVKPSAKSRSAGLKVAI